MQRILIGVIVVLAIIFAVTALGRTSGGVDEFDAMQLVKYGLIVLLIASGVFASQRNFGEAARSLAIWALIILGLTTAYLYRNDLQDVGSRLSAGLIPGRAASYTDEEGFSTVVLYKAGNGHFVADASISGRPLTLMVDTGASSIALSYEDAERIGLEPSNLEFNQMVMTANGPARTAYVTLPTVEIGGIKRSNVRAGIAERGRLDTSLLGMNFLNTLTSFTFSGDELKLRD